MLPWLSSRGRGRWTQDARPIPIPSLHASCLHGRSEVEVACCAPQKLVSRALAAGFTLAPPAATANTVGIL